jgi:CheY-like chemotaxis protein
MEPALSRTFGPLYGRFQIAGLEAPAVEGRRRPLVVLAEFDAGILQLTGMLADSNGYDVRTTDDGMQAYAMVRALHPDLLVVGHRLFGISGLDVVRRVRNCHDLLIERTPVLVMDVRHGTRAVLDAFRSGADDYLEIPNELNTLLRTWRRVTGDPHRPAPLAALLNEDDLIRRAALTYLLESQPTGLEKGLGELLWLPDPEMRATIRWALHRIGTAEARALLARVAPDPWETQSRV